MIWIWDVKSDLGFPQEDHSYCRFGDAKIKPSLGSWHRGWEIQERLWYSKGTVLIHIISCDVLWLQPVFLMITMHIPCWCCPYIKSITKFIAHRFLLNWGGSRGYCTFSLITIPAPIGFGQLNTLLAATPLLGGSRTLGSLWSEQVGQRPVRRGAEFSIGDSWMCLSRMP